MPVLSAAQRRALMKKQAEVGLARNFERKSTEECEEVEELKAKVEAAKKAPPKPAPKAAESVKEQAEEKKDE